MSALPELRGCPSSISWPCPHCPATAPAALLSPVLSYQVCVLEPEVAPGHHLAVAMGPRQCLLGALSPVRAAGQQVSFVHWLWVRGGSGLGRHRSCCSSADRNHQGPGDGGPRTLFLWSPCPLPAPCAGLGHLSAMVSYKSAVRGALDVEGVDSQVRQHRCHQLTGDVTRSYGVQPVRARDALQGQRAAGRARGSQHPQPGRASPPAGPAPTVAEWPCTGPYPHSALARGHKIGLEAQVAGVDVVDPAEPVPVVGGTQ